MKGFLFSIEALITLSIVILAVSTFWYASSFQTHETNEIQIQQQSDKAMTLYFNQNPIASNTTSNTQYCSKISYYNYGSKGLDEKTICRWVNE